MEETIDDDNAGERFEIEIPGGEAGHNVISIDARYVSFATIFPDDD